MQFFNKEKKYNWQWKYLKQGLYIVRTYAKDRTKMHNSVEQMVSEYNTGYLSPLRLFNKKFSKSPRFSKFLSCKKCY